LILILFVRGGTLVLRQVGTGDFFPLVSELTLCVVGEQNIWCSNFSNEILVSAVVVFFSAEQADPQILCYQMDEKLYTLKTTDRFQRQKESVRVCSPLKPSLGVGDSTFLTVHPWDLSLIHVEFAISKLRRGFEGLNRNRLRAVAEPGGERRRFWAIQNGIASVHGGTVFNCSP